ncbi:hypothetical protein [Pendulispora albinea]|uniref:Uncharacterized protein n=1 Tax=Pendulispora albinea TaxID=2741071 RepID=A0ABZ2LSR0_9BACT
MSYNVKVIIPTVGLAGMLVALLACSGDDDDASTNVDPRCVQLCTIKEPSRPDAYDICSEQSARTCRSTCAARLTGTSGACSQCLLDKAYFGAYEPGASCSGRSTECGGGTQCTLTGSGGKCSYCENDPSRRDACIREAHPRRTIDCTAHYEPVSACASFCS